MVGMYQPHYDLLKKGVTQWNSWKRANPHTAPDFQDADLSNLDLSGYDLKGANFTGANLSYTILNDADLSDSLLINVRLNNAHLCRTNLRYATIENSSLFNTNMAEADLTEACLHFSALVYTNLEKAILVNVKIFGISVWDIKLDGAIQKGLVISFGGMPEVMVDNLDAAQFTYMLMNNEKFSSFIESVGSGTVLILGRFTEERVTTLRKIKTELSKLGYVPVLFDFPKPENRNVIETVGILASISKFVIADFSDARTVNAELIKVVDSMAVPFIPIIIDSQEEPSCIDDERINHLSIVDTFRYIDDDDLSVNLLKEVIEPCIKKSDEMMERGKIIQGKRKQRRTKQVPST